MLKAPDLSDTGNIKKTISFNHSIRLGISLPAALHTGHGLRLIPAWLVFSLIPDIKLPLRLVSLGLYVFLFFFLEIKCPWPPDPSNGYLDKKDNTLGSTSIYKCHNGFRVDKNHIRKCLENGSWSGTDGECKGRTLSYFHLMRIEDRDL